MKRKLITILGEYREEYDFNHITQYHIIIDTVTNVIYYNTKDTIHCCKLEDIELMKSQDKDVCWNYVLEAMLSVPLSEASSRCNYTQQDLEEYLISIANNETICQAMFDEIKINYNTESSNIVVMDIFLGAITKANPVLSKRLYMELKLSGYRFK